MSLNIRNM